MTRGLVVFASAIALASQAHADPRRGPSLTTNQPATHAHRSLSFRLVQDRDFDPDPVHHSGVVASTEIAPNASLGFGLLRSQPKRPSGDWKSESGAPRSRKAAVSFLIKF